MKKQAPPSTNVSKFFPPDVQEQLKKVFTPIKKEIAVFLIKGKDDDAQALKMGRDFLKAFQEVTGKIRFKELDLTSDQAHKWQVLRSPALVFAPDDYHLHYLGWPFGEEGRTLVEGLLLIGLGDSGLNDQTRRVLKRIDTPRKVRVFVSPTCPYCPQQAVNAIKAAIERPDIISVEIVDTSFNQDLAELYAAFSVPQTFANDVLIAKGAQPTELFAASLEKMEEESYFIPESDAQQIETDLLIIGGGPAGLSAGIYAARSGLKTVIIEKDTLGGQMATTPIIENYPGLAHVGGKNLVDIMVAHALEYVRIFPREKVLQIDIGQPFQVTTSLRRFTTRAVLLATGAKNKKLGAQGETRFVGRGVSYCSTCDGPLFKGKKVAIVGGGNSAVTEALHLHHIGVQVTLIHRRDSLKAQESLVKNLKDNQIPILWNTEVKEIIGKEKVSQLVLYNLQTQQTETFPIDGLFVAIGYDPEVELAQKLGVDITREGYIKHDGFHRTNVPGLYSAGDVEGGYMQIVIAAGSGAAAAMTIFEDLSQPFWREKR